MNNINDRAPESKKKKWVGIIFLVIGLLMLSKQLGIFIPGWVMSFPMLLILVGVVIGRKHNYQNPASYILIIIGAIFLLDDIFKGIDFHDFAWPIAIMGVGLYLILGKKKHFSRPFRERYQQTDEWDKRVYTEGELADQPTAEASDLEGEAEKIKDKEFNAGARNSTYSSDDYLDTVAVFGGVKKNIVSRNFKEGDVTTIMGGAEINFIQADIQGIAILDVTQLFGGTKIIVPQNWKVASEMVAIFGGVEDKRPIIHGAIPSDEKVLIIRGTSIFGGIDIRSY
jgi:predicted membrane protein